MYLIDFHKLIEAPSIYYFIASFAIIIIMVIFIVFWDKIFKKDNENVNPDKNDEVKVVGDKRKLKSTNKSNVKKNNQNNDRKGK